MRAFLLLVCVAIGFSCGGCSEFNAVAGGWDKAELEKNVMQLMNKKIKAVGCVGVNDCGIGDVQLVQETPNVYTGVAIYQYNLLAGQNYTKIPWKIKVTTDRDSYQYQIVN